ncbi:MAG: L,D-transpeptidase [Roseibacillus sp.]
MTSKEFTLRWVLSALTCLALAVDAQVENPLGPEGLLAEPVELAARSPSSSPQSPADPVSEAPDRGVVIEAEIADESELARAKVRDVKADANVETALDRATKPKDLEIAVRLQIFLDQKRFGPGFIDGKPGKFTTKAVHAYNRSVGRVPDDWSALLSELNGQLGETFATAIVPELASQWVNSRLPRSYALQAKQKRMAYRSYLEFMAERYHTSESFLIELNGTKKANGARPRRALKVPNVEPFMIEKLAEGRTHRSDETLSARIVVIDTKGRNLFIYEKGEAPKVPGAAVVVSEKEADFEPQKLIAMFPITPGKVQYIHRGEWAIANCFELPSWRYDKQFLRTGKRSKDKSKVLQIPSGPNVPVGILWSGLTKAGIGIHGTSSPRTIGRSLSAGCIRLANWDAARFPEIVRPGAKVLIR